MKEHAHDNEGHSLEQTEAAARFAGLVQCTLEEAHYWLRRSAGTIETALDSYLAHQTKSKRQRTTASPASNSTPLRTSANLETFEGVLARSPYYETSIDSSENTGQRKTATSSTETSAASEVLVIEIADESEDESATRAHDLGVCAPDGSAGDKPLLTAEELEDGENCPVSEAGSHGIIERPLPPALSDLPDNFSFSLGECVATGTVTSGTINRLSLTDPLSLMAEVRLSHVQKAGSQQGFRKTKGSNSGYKIVYVHLNDPLLIEYQKRLAQPERRYQGLHRSRLPSHYALPAQLEQGQAGSRGCSPLAGVDFHNMLSSISEQTTFLRLLIDGREAVRFDRQVASSLSTLLLLGAVKVKVSWLPDRLPPRRLAVNSTLSVRMAVSVTLQALCLSALKQTGDPYLNQVHFPVLMGQAFASLMQLMGLQAINGPSTRRELDPPSAAADASEDLKLRQRLESLRGSKSPAVSGPADLDKAPEKIARGPHIPSPDIPEDDERDTKEDSCSALAEEEEEASESSTALCRLVLGGDAAAEEPQQHQQRQRRLGKIYPPASVFLSHLRLYQAQGLWWMLQCESEESVFLKDEHEALDPLWTVYRLPRPKVGLGARDGPSGGEACSCLQGDPACFVPSYFYLNVSAGLVSIAKPRYTGRVKGGILADCMGLGKTVQVLALIAVSALWERDPLGADLWLKEKAGAPSEKAGTTSRSAVVFKGLNRSSPAAKAEACVISPLASQEPVAPPSPVSVSSDGESAEAQPPFPATPCRPSATDASAPTPERPQLLAPDPGVLKHNLKRDKDNLLQGGTLIVVPLSLIGQWQSEVEKHLVHGVATVLQYYGPCRPRSPELIAAHTIVLTTYQTLASDFRSLSKLTFAETVDTGVLPELAHTIISRNFLDCPLTFIRFRRVILDEGHVIKNTSSLINRACNALKADCRWVLTGTPLQNDLSDAFALVQFLRVSPMGSQRWWRTKVTQTMERGMVRAAIETVRNILFPLMLRRHGDDLGEDGKPLLPLPPITVHTFKVQLTYEERLFYQMVFEHSKAKFDQLVQTGQVLQHYTHVLQLLLRLRQACNHPSLPSYREDLRSRQVIDLIRSPDPPAVPGRQAKIVKPLPSFPLLVGGNPFLSKFIEDAVKGGLEDCPVCFEFPSEAVVLTSCWHTLCMTCALLLQSKSKGAAAACPTCRGKFLPQHVRRLPTSFKPREERWRQMVLKKHRVFVAASRSKGVHETKELYLKEENAQVGEGTGTSSTDAVSASMPSNSPPVGQEDLSTSEEDLFQGVPSDAFFFSTKMRLLLALLEADVTAGRSCVIFSQWTSMLDLLEIAFEKAEAARRSSNITNATTEIDDDVMQVGVNFALREQGQQNGASTLNKRDRRDELAPLLCSSRPMLSARLITPSHRLFHYQRIDGTLGLEARQRIIRWFSVSETGQMTAANDAFLSTPHENQEGPFMGRCRLKPFNEMKCCPQDPAEKTVYTAPHSIQKQVTTQPASPDIQAALLPTPHLGKILLLSLKTGNVGLNLVKATRCYLVDGWWNPQVEEQAMRRLWRYGQDKPVSVYRFVCAKTVEERMEELVEWKGRLSRSTLRHDDEFGQRGKVRAREDDEESMKKGSLSLQDLKKLFEGWDTKEEPS